MAHLCHDKQCFIESLEICASWADQEGGGGRRSRPPLVKQKPLYVSLEILAVWIPSREASGRQGSNCFSSSV